MSTPTDDYGAKAREPIVHELKCWPEPFQAVKSGAKTFEWRKDDRDYQVGDMLWLNEWDTRTDVYTGSPTLVKLVTYVIREGFGIPPGYCIMGLGSVAHSPTSELVGAGNALNKAVHRYRQARPNTDENTNAYLAMVNAQLAWDAALSAHPKEVAPTVEETVDELMEFLEDYIEEGIEEMHDHSSDHGWQYDRGHPNWNATMDDLRTRLTKLLTTP